MWNRKKTKEIKEKRLGRRGREKGKESKEKRLGS